ncbi:MAG: sulfatase [Gammaproteobacteria bacterium]|nr:sulfatase [Gammaproteobacteria bacterium]
MNLKFQIISAALISLLLGSCGNGIQKEQVSGQSLEVSSSERPNILFIMVDDLGWHDIGAYGERDIDTPNLDQLAKQGMLFTNAYASAPVCSPSRAGAITGISPARLGLTNHISRQHFAPEKAVWLDAETALSLPNSAVTFAEVLKEQGYATGFFGKWHLSLIQSNSAKVTDPSTLPEAQGFDVNIGGGAFGGPPSWWSPYKNPYITDGEKGEYLPTRLVDEVVSFMSEQKDKKSPFLAVMWNYLVHSPLKAPADLLAKYEQRSNEGKNVGLPVYAAMIEAMDTSVGKVLKSLKNLNLAQDTLVVFTSDNGGVWKLADNGGLQFGKGWPYEGGVRVPLIIKWPGKIEADSTQAETVINTDFFPTFLDVASAAVPKDIPLEGESLLPLLTNTGSLQRDAIFFHYPNYAWHAKNRLGGAVISNQFKLIQWYDDDSVELYNLADDPYESNDLANAKPKLTKQLKKKFNQWLTDSKAKMPIKSPASKQ